MLSVRLLHISLSALSPYSDNSIHTAPSAAPSSVALTDVTSSTITVQWGEVPCIHQNGVITGYSVQYRVVVSGNTHTMSVDGGTTTETTIGSLMSSTTYSVQVAAVNSEGTGVYSDPEMSETFPSRPVVLNQKLF